MIYIYVGNDSAYIKHLIKQEIARVNKGEYELLTYSAYDDLLDDVLFDLSAFSLTGIKRVAVYDRCFFLTSNKERSNKLLNHDLSCFNDFLDYYDGRDDIFFITTGPLLKNDYVDRLKKSSKVIIVEQLKNDELYAIASKYFSKKDIKIDNYALKELVSRVENDFGRLMCELEKLENVGKTINLNDIAELVSKPLGDNIFDLTTYLLQGQTIKALELYKDLQFKGNDPHLILAVISSQISFLSQISYFSVIEHRTNDEIASYLKCHPYRVKVSMSLVANKKPIFFYCILKDLCDLEKYSKIDNENIKISLELFIAKFKYNYLK